MMGERRVMQEALFFAVVSAQSGMSLSIICCARFDRFVDLSEAMLLCAPGSLL